MTLQQRKAPFRDARLHVIAMEGERTEPWYFDGLRRHGLSDDRRVLMKLLPPRSGDSSPVAVLARLDQVASTEQLRAFDELWLVVDTDRWPRDQIHAVELQARERGWSFLLSNPCFEVWLLLHGRDGTTTPLRAEAKKAWRAIRAREQSGAWPFEREVVERAIARSAEADDGSSWPGAGQTRVHRLVARLVGRGVS